MAAGARWRRSIAGLALAATVMVGAPGCARFHPPCPVSDLTVAEDTRTARAALVAAADAADMSGIRTEVRTIHEQVESGPTGISTDEYASVRLWRSVLVDFAPLEPPVEALEREGFERTGGTGDRIVTLERGQQRARVESGLRLRDNPGDGKLWFTIEVTTGCRPV